MSGGENGIYTFTMPAAPVIVNASFVKSTPTAINSINIGHNTATTRYNIMGQPVDNNYKGIVIENGTKKIIK